MFYQRYPKLGITKLLCRAFSTNSNKELYKKKFLSLEITSGNYCSHVGRFRLIQCANHQDKIHSRILVGHSLRMFYHSHLRWHNKLNLKFIEKHNAVYSENLQRVFFECLMN